MSRSQLLLVWVLIVVSTPFALIVLLIDILAGADKRAKTIAIAFDEVGNTIFGGQPNVTISEKTGNALLEGKLWAKIAAFVIDGMFGKGHCLSNATKKS
jgi:hypothetical protein